MRSVVVGGLAGVVLALAACGGDSGGAKTDEKYVAVVCKATRSMQEKSAAVKLPEDADEAAMREALKDFAPIFKQWADELAKAKPPADVKDFHAHFLSELRKAAEALEKGSDGDPFLGLETLEPLAADTAARLDGFAARNPDCQAAEFRFSDQ